MKLKVLLSLGLLALASSAANAATYTLQYISYSNAFAIDYRIPGGTGGPGGGTFAGACAGCLVSTATTTGGIGDAVTIVGAAWSSTGNGQVYSNSWDGTSVVGSNVLLTKTGRVCTQTAGTFCANIPTDPNGFAGGGGVDTWYQNLAQNGTSACAFCFTDITVSGTQLLVKRSMALSAANTSAQSYTLVYSTVPVPAAVWLFGSSLGLLGLARRNRQAA